MATPRAEPCPGCSRAVGLQWDDASGMWTCTGCETTWAGEPEPDGGSRILQGYMQHFIKHHRPAELVRALRSEADFIENDPDVSGTPRSLELMREAAAAIADVVDPTKAAALRLADAMWAAEDAADDLARRPGIRREELAEWIERGMWWMTRGPRT